MFTKLANCVVVDRGEAEKLFSALGCVNVKQWDSDIIVQRLKRIALLCDSDVDVGQYQELLDAVVSIGASGTIVLRNDASPVALPIAVADSDFSNHRSGKSKGKRRTNQRRGAIFSFAKCGIPVGSVLFLKKNPEITCKVVGDPWVVDFGDGVMESFTSRTKTLLGAKESTYLSPMNYWMYEGKLLRHYYREKQAKREPKKKPKRM